MSRGPILLVDDNSDHVVLVERALSRAGRDVELHVLGDGDEAVDYLAGQGAYADRGAYPLPAVMLLDLNLPRRTGFEVMAWLRHQPPVSRLPVVVFTGSSDPHDVNRAYDMGANGYLVKPDRFRALVAMLAGLIDYWVEWNVLPALT